MLIPPLALPVLNATNLLHLNGSSPTNDLTKAPIFCYQPRPPDKPERGMTTYHDCMRLARTIIMGGKPYAQVDFSQNPKYGVKTPHRVVWGSCVFEVDIDPNDLEPEQRDEKSWAASFYEISEAAINIFGPCVITPPHMGGFTKVGRDQVLDLHVKGWTPWDVGSVS